MRRLITLALLLALSGAASAGQNYTANSTTYDAKSYADLLNSALTPQTNGTVAWCGSCTQAPVCAAGGSGALAIRANGAWQCAAGTTSGVINVLAYGAKGDSTTDNTAAFKAAVIAAGQQGTIFVPPGAYMWTDQTALHFTGTQANGGGNLSVTIQGNNMGDSILMPKFSGGDAISFKDPTNETPTYARGGVRNISLFSYSLTTPPTGLNLIHVSDVLGETFEHVFANNFYGAGDNFILLDPGVGSTGYVELTTMIDIRSYFNTNMLTMDIEHFSTSLNNNQLIGSHCELPVAPGDVTGACLNFNNMVSGTAPWFGSQFQFNADALAAGESIIKTNSSPSDIGVVHFNIIAQYVPNTAGAYCFNGPNTGGVWSYFGTVECNGTAFSNNNLRVINDVSAGSPSLAFEGAKAILSTGAVMGNATPIVGGGGVLALGSNSVSGEIQGVAATGNVLNTGVTCPHNVIVTFQDIAGGSVSVTAHSSAGVGFSATAGHTVDYIASCI